MVQAAQNAELRSMTTPLGKPFWHDVGLPTMNVRTPSPSWARFGAYVREQRLNRGLSQTHVAELLNAVTHRASPYGQGHIAAYEAGERLFPEVVQDYYYGMNLNLYEVVRAIVMREDDSDVVDRELVRDLFDTDPALDDDMKRHIQTQYEFLRETATRRRESEPGNGDKG